MIKYNSQRMESPKATTSLLFFDVFVVNSKQCNSNRNNVASIQVVTVKSIKYTIFCHEAEPYD